MGPPLPTSMSERGDPPQHSPPVLILGAQNQPLVVMLGICQQPLRVMLKTGNQLFQFILWEQV